MSRSDEPPCPTKVGQSHGKSCDPPDGGSVTIDAAYLAKSDVIIRERLQKAGVRLAHLLDSVFAD